MELKKVISELEKFDGRYKREKVTFAIEHQKEITPHLISILKEVTKNPIKFIQDKNYFGHIYALMLLGYFKEEKAHKVLIELFCLPDSIIDGLFGDIAAAEFTGALYQSCGGSVDEIKKLALNKNVPDLTRNSACDALLYAVVDRIITREEALRFLSTLFTGEETTSPSDFWGLVACDICDLCPDKNSYEVIKQAYFDNLIHDGIVAFEEFQEAIDLGVEASLNNIRQDKQARLLDDIHEMMSWWACFEGYN
ncbi:MAG: DUF1186 domain-containing protein [candidate division KSB1 bacterium]|nr:DUF1186 domain-containing protein [candidate division KSB1 bacterium]